jgi:hypothetical protein
MNTDPGPWRVSGTPARVENPGDDFIAYRVTLEGDDGMRTVDVRISRTALRQYELDRAKLPPEVLEAIQTNGVRAVEPFGHWRRLPVRLHLNVNGVKPEGGSET